MIAMRWLYFPLVFLLLFLYLPLNKLNKYNSVLTKSLVACVILYMGINSYILNRYLWHSPEIFFKQEVLHFKNYFYAGGLANIFKDEKESELAMALYQKNFKTGVRRAIIFIDYAELLIDKNEPEKALDYLDVALKYCFSQKKLGLIYGARGMAYFKLKNMAEAKKYFQKAIAMLPEEPVYWENLGVAEGAMGNHSDAIESFKKALTHGIESTSIQKNLANAYLAVNECEKAHSIVKRFKKRIEDTMIDKLSEKVNNCLHKNEKENG
jgi:tetratricopeptide (TPR) repeat protein